MHIANQTYRFIVVAMLATFVMTAVGMSAANAQQPQTPTASSFLANPGQLLQQNPNGGALLANVVQQLVLSDPATFKVVLGLLTNANDAQKSAIGQGLAQAAKIKVLTDQAVAEDWQQQIAALDDPVFKTAAINAFGDVQLGAVGGAAAGAAGAGLGGAGGSLGGGGGLQNIQSTPAPTQSFTFTGGTSGSGASTSTTTITTTTITSSVSESGL